MGSSIPQLARKKKTFLPLTGTDKPCYGSRHQIVSAFAGPADPASRTPDLGPWGVQSNPQTTPGVVKIDPWRVPGGSWTPLSSSGEPLGVVAGVLEGSKGMLGGVLVCPGAIWGSFWRLLGPSWEPIRSPKGAPRVPKKVGIGAPSWKWQNRVF